MKKVSRLDEAMTEAQLLEIVVNAAEMGGWRHYHTHDSRRSAPGFPDLVLVRSPEVLWRELKTTAGRVTAEQHAWIADLQDAGQDAEIVRPGPDLDCLLARLTQRPSSD